MSGNSLDFHNKLDQVDWVKEKIVAEFKSELTNLETEVANSTLEAALKSQDSAALETAANNVLQKCLDDMTTNNLTFRKMIEKRGAAYVLALQIKLKLTGQNPGDLDGMRGGDTRKAVEARQIAYNTANPTAIIEEDGRAGKNTLPLIIDSSALANPPANPPASDPESNENAPDITEMIEGEHYEIKNGVFTLLVEPKTLQKVKELELPANFIVEDIQQISQLEGLEVFTCGESAISDLSPLKNLTNLKKIKLHNVYFNGDFTPLIDLKNLQTLEFIDNEVADLSPLKHLTNLKSLYISSDNLSDLNSLKHLTNLEKLTLMGENIKDLKVLENLKNLKDLTLEGEKISDISAIKDLKELEKISIFDTNVSDITALEGLTGLTYLNLRDNKITDITALEGLTGLTYLNLRDNKITDITALEGLTGLTDLGLEGNNITDITALKGLTGLTDLGLGGNNITDISTLSKLTKLEELYLGTQGFPGLYQNGYKSQLGSILPTLNQLTNLQVSHLLKNDPIIQLTKILRPKVTLKYDDA